MFRNRFFTYFIHRTLSNVLFEPTRSCGLWAFFCNLIPVGMPLSRRSHKKSKTGCLSCKKRRIKVRHLTLMSNLIPTYHGTGLNLVCSISKSFPRLPLWRSLLNLFNSATKESLHVEIVYSIEFNVNLGSLLPQTSSYNRSSVRLSHLGIKPRHLPPHCQDHLQIIKYHQRASTPQISSCFIISPHQHISRYLTKLSYNIYGKYMLPS